MHSSRPSCIALIPAAGSGQRLGGQTPKQYQSLCGLPMLVHTVRALQTHVDITDVFVVLAPEDTLFKTCCSPYLQHCTPLYVGSRTRAQSVLEGLKALPAVTADTWVLVHDAARPCLHKTDIHSLIDAVYGAASASAFVLATPVADTLKRVNSTQEVLETVARNTLWQAQTPQVARYAQLVDVLTTALMKPNVFPTDEAQAFEWAGHPVKLVAAQYPNFKVTYPADQFLAEAVLSSR